MNSMFADTYSLTYLDLSSFNTINVTDMSYMFCINGSTYNSGIRDTLTKIIGIENFNTSNVTNMQQIFDGCSLLTSLVLSNFNTTSLTNASYMFRNCSKINITLNIHSNPSSYNGAFYNAVTESGSGIVVNYNVNTSNIDNIIATKSSNSNVTKGSLFYDIIYYSNEGSKCQSTPVMSGDSVTTLCTPTKDGYTFEGWYTDDETFNNRINIGYTPNNTQVYAKWTSN